MADQKLRELTETTTPESTDLAYLVVDPDGTPLDRKVEIGTLLGNLGAWQNLIKNSPGQIYGAGKDGAEPEWWDDSGSATITDEDTAGEGIADSKGERVFKVVTVADDHYGYQSLTFSDESLLDAGVTVVSFSCWVYCANANMASIGIYGTNLGLEESAQVGAGAWELLTVENITLDAADTAIQVRLIVDTGTAYFGMPMLNIGSCALPWKARQELFVAREPTWVLSDASSGDVAWSDLDFTATSHNLATGISVIVKCSETDGSIGSSVSVGHHSDITGADGEACGAQSRISTATGYAAGHHAFIRCNDTQNIRYTVAEADADSDVRAYIGITGYWRWE